MASLPPTLNFSDAEEEICKKWKEEDIFRLQNKLSKERGDKVSQIKSQKSTKERRHMFLVFAPTHHRQPVFIFFLSCAP
jgi:hypothetical protein